MNETNQLAKKLKPRRPPFKFRTGVVVSFTAGTPNRATVTIGGDDIAGIPVYAHVGTLTSGHKVDVLFDGESPRVIGRF